MKEWMQRTELLLGSDRIERLRNARVLVVGLGGVGAYAAEAIARAGVGTMTLRSIPSDRLFLETDMSGEEIESVYRRAADIRNEPAESLRDAVHTNYLNLFGL